MSKAIIPPNPLVQDSPVDTLTACRNTAAFLQEVIRKADDVKEDLGDGLNWVFSMLYDALDYEAKRAVGR